MKKLITLWVAFTLMVFTGCSTLDSPVDALTKALPAIVSIQVPFEEQRTKVSYVSDSTLRFGDEDESYIQDKLRTGGTGVLIDSRGFIVTNQHVVDGREGLYVELSDGRYSKAILIGLDPDTDLAVIQVPAAFVKGITPLKLGDSDKVLPGEAVFAVGAPKGLAGSVSSGVVSALHRRGYGFTRFEDYIQTDAAINPGNSGGPLLNSKGEVIGINTIMMSSTRDDAGMNFSISSNLTKVMTDRIRKLGHAPVYNLGLKVTTFRTPTRKGTVVLRSKTNTAILPGDYVTHIQGKAVEDSHHFTMLIAMLVGDLEPVELTVERKGLPLPIKFTIVPF